MEDKRPEDGLSQWRDGAANPGNIRLQGDCIRLQRHDDEDPDISDDIGSGWFRAGGHAARHGTKPEQLPAVRVPETIAT